MPELSALVELLPVAMLAGLFGLDVVSFPQAMISRPLVAATIGGAFFGAPVAGLVCGVALECLALEALPVGASRYPEWGSASIVAGALAARGASGTSLPLAGALTVAVAIGIATAWLGGWTMVRHRQLIASFARPRLDQLAAGNRRTVVGLQVFGMTADLARGAALGLLVYVPSRLIVDYCSANWHTSESTTRAVVVTCGAAVAATAVWKDFHAISLTRRLFLGSLAVGSVLVMLRG
jgi:mannose/fructose/N-acetylgalactosamine-specific phosphotransferase system component IIC